MAEKLVAISACKRFIEDLFEQRTITRRRVDGGSAPSHRHHHSLTLSSEGRNSSVRTKHRVQSKHRAKLRANSFCKAKVQTVTCEFIISFRGLHLSALMDTSIATTFENFPRLQLSASLGILTSTNRIFQVHHPNHLISWDRRISVVRNNVEQ